MPRILKDSGIPWAGQIPGNWYVHRVKFHFQHHKYIAGVKASNYDRLALTMQGVIKRSKEDNDGLQPLDFTSYQVLKKDELVFKLIDLQNISTSRVGLSPFTGVVSPAYIILHAQKDTLPRYAMYFFLFMWLDNIFNSLGDAGVRSSLNASDLLNLPFILPSLEEQKKIADFLDKKCGEVDALAHNIQQQIDTLEQYKRAIITETVTKGLNPSAPMKDSGIPWIGQIPKHWAQCKIKNICTLIGSGTTPDSSISMFYDEGTINWIQSGDVYGKSFITNVTTLISQVALKSSPALKIYSAPFIVIAMYGGSVGNTAISMINACTNQACCCLKPNPHTDLKFLFYWINFCKEDFLLRAEGGGQPNISQNKIKNQFFCAPPFKEQQALASYLDDKCGKIDALIKTKQEQLAKLEEYKKAIIFEYVTGKKPVPEEER